MLLLYDGRVVELVFMDTKR